MIEAYPKAGGIINKDHIVAAVMVPLIGLAGWFIPSNALLLLVNPFFIVSIGISIIVFN